MSNIVNITKAAELAGVSRQTISRKVTDGTLSKCNNGKIDISELIRVYPNIKIEEKSNTLDCNKTAKNNTMLQNECDMLTLEIKYLKEQVNRLQDDKEYLQGLVNQQTLKLPDYSEKSTLKWWWRS